MQKTHPPEGNQPKNGDPVESELIVSVFAANLVIGGQCSVFSVQFSVFSVQQGENSRAPRAACRPCESDSGGQAASGTRKFRPIGAQKTGGLVWAQIGKRVLHNFAHLFTCLHKPTRFRHMPAHAGTSRSMPARSCTTVEPPSPTCKPLHERYLHRWIRSCFAFRGGRQAGLGRVAKGLKSNDLCMGRACRGDRRFAKNIF